MGTLVGEGKTLDDHGRVQEILAKHEQTLTLDEIASVVDPQLCLRQQRSLGSTGPREVARMHKALTKATAKSREATTKARAAVEAARGQTARIVKSVLGGKALAKAGL